MKLRVCARTKEPIKLTKLAFDRAEYLVKSAELGRLAFEEFSFFDVRFSVELELSAPRSRSNFLFLADITCSSLLK